MGVPAFYRWLSQRYSKIVVYAKENDYEDPNLDLTSPNPNNYEFDNLYLDMNCLIHPCTHPEDGEAPKTEEEMFVAIFKYVDRLFAVVRPRKLLYLAIDGVAPRAKMNQQRSRRFRAAQEAEDMKKDAAKLREEIINAGKVPPKEIAGSDAWDTNVITPGTKFMEKLSKSLREYIIVRQNTTPAWGRIKVVFSDSSFPGEGEHKLMDFIRSQKAQKGYDPNTKHCLYGLDADLIMLGLATHEVYFTILREEVLFGKEKQRKTGFAVDAVLKDQARGDMESKAAEAQLDDLIKLNRKKPFQFLHLWILREYLEFEFQPKNFPASFLRFELNLERCIDDFIFLCFFVGNDFLPHLPTLSIREGGLELILDLYKRFVPTLDGYLTTAGVIHFERVEVILTALGTVEDEIFRRRRAFEKNHQTQRLQAKQAQSLNPNGDPRLSQPPGPRSSGKNGSSGSNNVQMIALGRNNSNNSDGRLAKDGVTQLMNQYSDQGSNLKRARSGKKRTRENDVTDNAEIPIEEFDEGQEVDVHSDDYDEDDETELIGEADANEHAQEVFKEQLKEFIKRKNRFEVVDAGDLKAMRENQKQGNRIIVDEVILGEYGWKERYYKRKFPERFSPGISSSAEEKVLTDLTREVVKEYVRGLSWVLLYYYRGCVSWRWYYPFHYAPFASDFINLTSLNEEIYGVDPDKVSGFELGKPFTAFEQLMGVLPAKSAHALPAPFHWYMKNENSPIIDFYPIDFKYDPNGAGVQWLWIALLPFVDEVRLQKAMKEIEPKLSSNDLKRNERSDVLVFVNVDQTFGKTIHDAVLNKMEKDESTSVGDQSSSGSKGRAWRVKLKADQVDGLSGYFYPLSTEANSFAPSLGMRFRPKNSSLKAVDENKVLVVKFKTIKVKPRDIPTIGRILEGVNFPDATLKANDFSSLNTSYKRGGFVGNLYAEVHKSSTGLHSYDRDNSRRNGGDDFHNRMEETFQSAASSRPRFTGPPPVSWGSMEPRAKLPRMGSGFSHSQTLQMAGTQGQYVPRNYGSNGAGTGGASNTTMQYSYTANQNIRTESFQPRNQQYGPRPSRPSGPRIGGGPPPARPASRGNSIFDHIESQLKRNKRN